MCLDLLLTRRSPSSITTGLYPIYAGVSSSRSEVRSSRLQRKAEVSLVGDERAQGREGLTVRVPWPWHLPSGSSMVLALRVR